MPDLPAMEPCPVPWREGAHRFDGIGMVVGEGSDVASLTFVCRYCGALRRVPGFGDQLLTSRLDDASAEQIMDAVTGSGWEIR